MVDEVADKDMMKRKNRAIDSLASSVLDSSTYATTMAIQGMLVVDRQMCRWIALLRSGGRDIEGAE
tara:strand:- start:314 stop:511 length:198 start_codon:yes stop_codon:yes gene_type:complete